MRVEDEEKDSLFLEQKRTADLPTNAQVMR